MDEMRDEIEVLPAVAGSDGDGHELVVHADLERLRREVAAPAIVREAGPDAEYAYADFFKAKISNPNTRKAYKRAVDRFLGWCRVRGLELRQVTSFLVGDYVEHHLVDKDGRPLAPPSIKQHLAGAAALLRQPAEVPRRRHQPRLQRPRARGTPPARARRPPSTTAGPRPDRLRSAPATSSGSATGRC